MPREIIPTSAAGPDSDWAVVGAANGWSAVLKDSGDSSFVSSSVLSERSSFFCGSGSAPFCGTIASIAIHYRMRQTVNAAGAVVDLFVTRNDIDELTGASVALTGTDFVEGVIRLRQDPVTAIRFSAGSLAYLGVGAEIATAPSSGSVVISQLWLEIETVDAIYYYDSLFGATPNFLVGDRDWNFSGTQSSAIVSTYLRLTDTNSADHISFNKDEIVLGASQITEIETRQIIKAVPADDNKYITGLGGRSDGTRDVLLAALKVGGEEYIGLVGSNASDLDDSSEYLALAQVDLVDQDINYLLRIDRDDDPAKRGRVQVFLNYSETPTLEAFYDQFPTTSTSLVMFGTGGAVPNSDNTQVDVDYISWKDFSKSGGKDFPSWEVQAVGGNQVIPDTTDPDIVKFSIINPPGIQVGQSNACCFLDINADTLPCRVSQLVRIPISGWSQKELYGIPSPRVGAWMVYDSVRDVVVLFGGDASPTTTYKNDTWEYDGSRWRQITTTTTPTARRWHGLTFDSDRGVVIMYGGELDPGTPGADHWEYDGTDWALISASAAPGARHFTSLTYDSVRKKTILFAGSNGSFVDQNDVWEYDTTNGWVQRIANGAMGSPSKRVVGGGFDFSPTTGKVLMFGGKFTNPGPTAYYSDTWEYDGSVPSWTQLTPTTTPTPDRFVDSLTYDPVTDKYFMFGGEQSTGFAISDTWEYDGTDWKLLSNFVDNPTATKFQSLVSFSSRKRLVMFGGDRFAPHNETWELNSSAPETVQYKIELDYKCSDSTTLARVTLQRCIDLAYYQGPSWSSNPVYFVQPFSATRTRNSVAINIEPQVNGSIWNVIVDYDTAGGPVGPREVRIYKVYLKNQ